MDFITKKEKMAFSQFVVFQKRVSNFSLQLGLQLIFLHNFLQGFPRVLKESDFDQKALSCFSMPENRIVISGKSTLGSC